MKNYLICLFFTIGITIIGCEKDTEVIVTPNFFEFCDWKIKKSTHGLELVRSIHFLNESIGFISGNGVINKTTNAGETWETINTSTDLPISDVFFVNENMGFASVRSMDCLNDDCGKGYILLRTDDGGETWTKTFFEEYQNLTELYFFDSMNGLAIIEKAGNIEMNYHIGRTEDGGETWDSVHIDFAHSYYQCFQPQSDVTFAIGKEKKIFKSTDKGITWQTVSTPEDLNKYTRSISFYNENVGILDDYYNQYLTKNGGETWSKIDISVPYFGFFHFSNEAEGLGLYYTLDDEGGCFPGIKGSNIYCTQDGGGEWNESRLFEGFNAFVIHFPNRDYGFGMNGNELFIVEKIQ